MKRKTKNGIKLFAGAKEKGNLKHILVFFFALLFLLNLSGCGKQTDGEDSHLSLSVYYVVNKGKTNPSDGEVIRAVPETLSAAEAAPETLLKILMNTPADSELSSPFPSGTSVQSLRTEGKKAVLDLSSAYGVLTGYDLTVADYCITLTLTQLPSIDEVTITVDGQPLSDGEQKVLRAEDVVLDDIEKEYMSIEVALYFLSTDNSSLQPEYRKISVKEESDLAGRIVEALISGPETAGLRRLLPGNSELMNLSVKNGCCKLTLSDGFWAAVPSGQKLQLLTIYSIVNSLTNLNSITEVQFFTAKEAALSYGSIDLRQPLGHKSLLSQTEKENAG